MYGIEKNQVLYLLEMETNNFLTRCKLHLRILKQWIRHNVRTLIAAI